MTKEILHLLARIFIAAIFVYEAYDSLAFAQATKEKMTAYHLTWQQDLVFIAGVVVLVIGALFLIIGYRSRFASVCLMLYWIPLTFIVHSFWNDPIEERRVQSIFFMRNIAIVGGLLMIYVHGSGKYSIRRLLDNRRIKS